MATAFVEAYDAFAAVAAAKIIAGCSCMDEDGKSPKCYNVSAGNILAGTGPSDTCPAADTDNPACQSQAGPVV